MSIPKNMKFLFYIILIQAFCMGLTAQTRMEKSLKKFNNESVPYIHTNDLRTSENIILLDTREKEEFNVSHLDNAIWVGHKTFTLEAITPKITDKNSEIIVYCSIGVRSEDVGELLQHAGYTNVKNLYGGIFEWKNKGYPVYDAKGNKTEKVHAFNKHWGKLLENGEKVYRK